MNCANCFLKRFFREIKGPKNLHSDLLCARDFFDVFVFDPRAVLIQRYSLPFSSNQLLTTYDHVTYSGFYALIYLDFSNVRLLAFLIQTAFEHHVTVIDAADHVTHFDDHETDYVDDPRETGIFAVCREMVSDADGHVILTDHLVQKQIVAILNGAFSNLFRLLY